MRLFFLKIDTLFLAQGCQQGDYFVIAQGIAAGQNGNITVLLTGRQ